MSQLNIISQEYSDGYWGNSNLALAVQSSVIHILLVLFLSHHLIIIHCCICCMHCNNKLHRQLLVGQLFPYDIDINFKDTWLMHG